MRPAQAQLNQIAKPLGSLGKLETLLCRVAAASGTAQIDVGKKCVLVFCADNGVVAQGVAQSGSEVTGAIAGHWRPEPPASASWPRPAERMYIRLTWACFNRFRG